MCLSVNLDSYKKKTEKERMTVSVHGVSLELITRRGWKKSRCFVVKRRRRHCEVGERVSEQWREREREANERANERHTYAASQPASQVRFSVIVGPGSLLTRHMRSGQWAFCCLRSERSRRVKGALFTRWT